MKLRWKVTIGLVAVGILAAVILSRREGREQRALEQTRRDLRAQGFKIDLAEFDFSTPMENIARIRALTNAYSQHRGEEPAARPMLLNNVSLELVQLISSDSATPVWKQKTWAMDRGLSPYLQSAQLPNDFWQATREIFASNGEWLDKACEAALSGPIRFPLNASHGNAMLLPHLAVMKNLGQSIGSRSMLELHDGRLAPAWTNVLAATRLVTAWENEPAEISHLVRVACCGITFNITWQALQTNGWSDEQLDRLQREWESADFFTGLPATAAFARAAGADSFQRERTEPMESFGLTLRTFLNSPKQAWANLNYWYQHVRYRRHGSYEDEKYLLLYYRDRELEFRHITQAQTWSEMRKFAGATNTTSFQRPKSPSGTLAMLNMRQLSLSWQVSNGGGPSRTVPARVAEAEARRRVIVTAIALERFRKRDGNYPKSLAELSPEFLKTPLVDFMDGQPLRYRLTDDGHFVLYSVGLDCVDNGGEMRRLRQRRIRPDEEGLGRPRESDLVWPRPASNADVEAFQHEQIRAMAEQTRQDEEQQADFQWGMTAERQLQAEKILAGKPVATSTEPKYRGRPLAEVLGNRTGSGTNTLKISDLLTLTSVLTGAEPEILTFDVPIKYDVLTNLGQLALLVDPINNESFFEDAQAGWAECHRATNGNCLLAWNTIYEAPGLHALQLALAWNDPSSDDESFATGPVAPFTVSNLCQFSLSSAYFKPELGATLRAKLSESNATYSLDITSPTGELLKTITGSTSDGLVTIHWDLVDDRGVRRTNSSFNTVIHVKLSDSGQSQTLRGP